MLPIVRRITERAACQAMDIEERLRFIPREEPLHRRLRIRLETTYKLWAAKVERLGCEPRGIWLIDFDAGDGWFSWRYGDDGLNFFHSHSVSAKCPSRMDELLT